MDQLGNAQYNDFEDKLSAAFESIQQRQRNHFVGIQIGLWMLVVVNFIIYLKKY